MDKLRCNYSVGPCERLFITRESSLCDNLPGERCWERGGEAGGGGECIICRENKQWWKMSGVQQSLNRASSRTQSSPGVQGSPVGDLEVGSGRRHLTLGPGLMKSYSKSDENLLFSPMIILK